VALEAGFRDARSFSAAFKRRFGQAPSDWRRPSARHGHDGPGPAGAPPGDSVRRRPRRSTRAPQRSAS